MLINKHLNLIKSWIEYLFPQNTDIDFTSNKSRPFTLFIFVIFVYSLFMIFTQPAYTLRGAMYAETATNYFTNANSDSYLDQFFATDAAYIPLPQRLIAYLGHILHLSAATIPYFYTWSAIILTAAMVGSFCLMPFRALIANDATRVLLSLCVLLMVEPATRVFMNFTYFSIFFIAVITSLAITQRSKEVPIYSWFIPFFMLSKPSIICTIPAMLLSASISKKRFKYIALISVLLVILHIIFIHKETEIGLIPPQFDKSVPLLSNLVNVFKYFLFSFTLYPIGLNNVLSFYQSSATSIFISTGILVLISIVLYIFKKPHTSNSLVIVGISLIFFGILINCFSTNAWSGDLSVMLQYSLFRWSSSIIAGYILIFGSILANIDLVKKEFKVLPFIIWLILSGWIIFASQMAKGDFAWCDKWQEYAHDIDNINLNDLCVPINPFGWVYGKNCSLLNKDLDSITAISKQFYKETSLETIGNNVIYTTPPQIWTNNRTIIAVAVIAAPKDNMRSFVNARAILKSQDGSTQEFTGSMNLPEYGESFFLKSSSNKKISNVTEMKLIFDHPVRLISTKTDNPAIMWMGY